MGLLDALEVDLNCSARCDPFDSSMIVEIRFCKSRKGGSTRRGYRLHIYIVQSSIVGFVSASSGC